MIAVDTNVLVYAHREDSRHHAAAISALRTLAGAGRAWAIPWPCLHEFLAIVTHPRIYDPPSSPDDALAAVSDLVAMPDVFALSESEDHLDRLAGLLTRAGVVGPKVHDARICRYLPHPRSQRAVERRPGLQLLPGAGHPQPDGVVPRLTAASLSHRPGMPCGPATRHTSRRSDAARNVRSWA